MKKKKGDGKEGLSEEEPRKKKREFERGKTRGSIGATEKKTDRKRADHGLHLYREGSTSGKRKRSRKRQRKRVLHFRSRVK